MAQKVFESLMDQPLLQIYAYYASILAVKLLLMSPLTGLQRMIHKAFTNPEDSVTMKVKPKISEEVERVRRAHLNDLENIPIFLAVSLIYLSTNPSLFLTSTLMRLFTLSRFIHSFVYAIVVIPQPTRAIAFIVGYSITFYMAVSTAMYYS